ncbi:hypothetical protein NDU88_003665 [Pleurodeles waltl]|uniref:Uncharacterized protein n=1 Tax=Pleurodeles waltl TaxID=8319 RepID=A0AAV7V0P9_PLEWA|nr:hypothetical protein NDU88_003665 [Pleurodeles waltl]
MLLSDGNVWNYGKVIRVPGGGNREKLPDLGRKSGNSVDDKTSTNETSLCKSGREGVKGVCSIQWILFLALCEEDSDVSARGIESSGRESGARRRQRRLRCLRVFLPVIFGFNLC